MRSDLAVAVLDLESVLEQVRSGELSVDDLPSREEISRRVAAKRPG